MKHMPAPKDDLRQRFILFLSGKPADLRYNWSCGNHCACATFIREGLTITEKISWLRFFTREVKAVDTISAKEVWRRWNQMASNVKPHTYGALLARVLEDRPEDYPLPQNGLPTEVRTGGHYPDTEWGRTGYPVQRVLEPQD